MLHSTHPLIFRSIVIVPHDMNYLRIDDAKQQGMQPNFSPIMLFT